MTALNNRKQTAKRLSMSVRRLIELEKAGKICAVQDGRIVKYTDDEIERYISQLPSYEPSTGMSA